MTERWIRSARAAVVEHGDRVLLVSADGSVHALDAASADVARAVIGVLGAAHTRDEILARVEALAGPLGERAAVIDELLGLLRATGVVAAAREPRVRTGIKIVVGVTGALAATHAPALVRALQQAGHTVEIALTPTAQRFVAIDALAAIAQRAVHTGLWPAAPHEPVPHVALAEWADVVVIYPASATTIARIAGGDHGELVAAIAGCTRAPVVLVPSMNATMLASPAVARNLELLCGDGRFVIGGVPSAEAAEAPEVRDGGTIAAPAPAELVATLEALRAAGVLPRPARTDWDAIYRSARVPWASDACDADIAAALEELPSSRVLDVGTGLGQIARHAAAAGHTVVATDISEIALELARAVPGGERVLWLRDDICATRLASTFDVVIDRATLHTLSPVRAAAWRGAVTRLVRSGGHLIVKTHRDGIPGATVGHAAIDLPGFTLVRSQPADLPGLANDTPIPSVFSLLRRA